ncbi:MAG: hypothetical protein LC789_00870 [Actinobacteria bacterium]|nr:hypothetical protein [Actinomycetota bacterium]MCA1720577.1 hypothetical protein [Actinomycetota bacterium]
MAPSFAARREAATLAAVSLACLLAAALLTRRLHGAVADDAFITYRYARNLAGGHGWRYDLYRTTANGATAPLYTAVLGLGAAIFGGVPRVASAIYVLTLAGTGVVLFDLLRRRGAPIAGVAIAALIVTSPWLASVRGMETVPFLFLAALTVWAYDRRLPFTTGMLLTALVLVRGDGVVLAAILTGAEAWRLRRVPLRLLVGALALAVPWAMFSLVVIGGLIPETLAAKVAQGRSGYWGTGLLFWHGLFSLPGAFGFSGWIRTLVPAAGLGVAALALVPLLRVLVPLVASGAALFAMYAFVVRPPVYHWYYGPLVLALLVLAGAGCGHLAAEGLRRGDVLRLAVGAGLPLLLVVQGLQQAAHPEPGLNPQAYVRLAAWIDANVPEEATVAASEIGMIGYFGNRDMIDYLGLLSEEAVVDLRHHDLAAWLLREYPDYWLVHVPVWGFEYPAITEPWFTSAYEPVWREPGYALYRRTQALDGAIADAGALRTAADRALAFAGIRDKATSDAVVSLLGVLDHRPDLQSRYKRGDEVNLSGLVTWATQTAAADTDSEAAVVHAFGPIYVRLAALQAPLASVRVSEFRCVGPLVRHHVLETEDAPDGGRCMARAAPAVRGGGWSR